MLCSLTQCSVFVQTPHFLLEKKGLLDAYDRVRIVWGEGFFFFFFLTKLDRSSASNFKHRVTVYRKTLRIRKETSRSGWGLIDIQNKLHVLKACGLMCFDVCIHYLIVVTSSRPNERIHHFLHEFLSGSFAVNPVPLSWPSLCAPKISRQCISASLHVSLHFLEAYLSRLL